MNIYLIGVSGIGIIGLVKFFYSLTKTKEPKRNFNASSKKRILLDLAHKMLYAFSVVQIKCKQLSRYLNKSNSNKICNRNATLTFLDKNVSIITNITQTANTLDNVDCEYEAFLLTDDKNKVFYENTVVDNILNYEVSNYRFINIELEYNDDIYIVCLNPVNANYYIVNNSLNAFFIKYYIRNVLMLPIDETKPFEYKLNIIDNNVNCFSINQEQSVKLTKDGYIIVNSE